MWYMYVFLCKSSNKVHSITKWYSSSRREQTLHNRLWYSTRSVPHESVSTVRRLLCNLIEAIGLKTLSHLDFLTNHALSLGFLDLYSSLYKTDLEVVKLSIAHLLSKTYRASLHSFLKRALLGTDWASQYRDNPNWFNWFLTKVAHESKCSPFSWSYINLENFEQSVKTKLDQ